MPCESVLWNITFWWKCGPNGVTWAYGYAGHTLTGRAENVARHENYCLRLQINRRPLLQFVVLGTF
jgi:hypothetical protein